MSHLVKICDYSHTGVGIKRYCPTCKGYGLNITKAGEKSIPENTVITYCPGS